MFKSLRFYVVSLPIFGIGGIATIAQVAVSSPPLTSPDAIAWLWTAPNPWVLITALFSALGAISAVMTFFQPLPYSQAQGKDDRAHANESFKTTNDRADGRRDDLLEAISRDKHEQALTEIISGKAEQELLDRYQRALAIVRPSGGQISQREAAQFALVAQESSQSDDPRVREIADLIDTGKIVEASDVKAELAEETYQTASRAAAAEMRDSAYLALPVSPRKAKAHLERATELDPEDIWSWIELGRLRMQYGSLADARACFGAALQRVSDERDRCVLHSEFGDVLTIEGQLSDARAEYEAALAIAESLSQREPGNAEWQRDLFISHAQMAQVAEVSGDSAGAIESFRHAESIIAALVTAWPDHPGFVKDLATVRRAIARLGG